DDHERARALRHECRELLGIGNEAALGPAGVMHDAAAIQGHGRGPQRVVGTRHEHFVVLVEERPQGEVDELAHAVAAEHLFRRNPTDAALVLLHHHRLACREYAFLVAVALSLGEVLDHGEPHALGGAEPEGARITDVEGEDLVALALEFVRAPREPAADLVTHVPEALARPDAGVALPGLKNNPTAACFRCRRANCDRIALRKSRASGGRRCPALRRVPPTAGCARHTPRPPARSVCGKRSRWEATAGM